MPDQTQTFTRYASADLKIREDAGKKLLNILASTSDPVDMGGWREILVHDANAVDATSCRALLLNHKAGFVAGAIRSIQFDGNRCNVEAELMEDARLESGVKVTDAVAMGALRGVSIGYGYDAKSCQYDEEKREVTVQRWILREVTLTPIPADAKAHVRALPAEITTRSIQEHNPMPEPATQPAPASPAAEPAKPQDGGMREIVTLAESVGLRASDYISHTDPLKAREAMLADLAKRQVHTQPAGPAITQVVADEGDKMRAALVAGIAHKIQPGSAKVDGNPFAGRGIREQFVRAMARMGVRDLGGVKIEDMDRGDQARVILGLREATAGNISTASLTSFVFLNSISKIVAKGFEMGQATVKYPSVVETQTVSDFKTYTIGALGFTNLQKTAENTAFPELTNSEGAYSSAAKMWGGTISLSIQALVSDDTAQFERGLRQAGAIAAKTIDRRVFQKLLMGTSSSEGTSTWTSNTTSGTSPVFTTGDTLAAARGRFQLGRVALATKVGLDGNPNGAIARFIVCGPTSGMYLRSLVAEVGGKSVGNESYEIVETPWLEATALTGYSTTSFYLLADPMTTTGLVLSKVAGFESVQVDECDMGAVAARGWKLWHPFEADLFYAAVNGTNTIPAAQQCTT